MDERAESNDGKAEGLSRRELMRCGARAAIAVGLGGAGAVLAAKGSAGAADRGDAVWQIDPYKCIDCGNCATYCVLEPSAVKCVHAFYLCGYCTICGGFVTSDAKASTPPHQLCPTNALIRRQIEDDRYEYQVVEDLCIGCGKCCKGCAAFGNGSLFLQVRHDLCINCNECAIAEACPAHAFVKVSADRPYLLKMKDIKR
jgi:electron transport complex protein RnfB